METGYTFNVSTLQSFPAVSIASLQKKPRRVFPPPGSLCVCVYLYTPSPNPRQDILCNSNAKIHSYFKNKVKLIKGFHLDSGL